MITCDEIINAEESASENVSANVMSIVSTNFHKTGCRLKTYCRAFNTKMDNKELQKVCIKRSTCYY